MTMTLIEFIATQTRADLADWQQDMIRRIEKSPRLVPLPDGRSSCKRLMKQWHDTFNAEGK